MQQRLIRSGSMQLHSWKRVDELAFRDLRIKRKKSDRMMNSKEG